jgi:hypothetical protein
VLGIGWQKVVKWLMTTLVVVGLALGVLSCGNSGAPTIPGISKVPSRLSEVAPPPALLELRKVLDVHQPQVSILSPRSNEVIQDTSLAVRLRVTDLPLFQDEKLGLGPHLHFILDNQPYEAIYDVSEPILLQDLTPGTHTIRVFASRPWHESFKNNGAYAQTTFHLFTKTPENNPTATQPLLTYSRPKGSYGAEPVMLDFYLANAPLHLLARESSEDEIVDWQIRCTINGESFTFDRWEPIYLKGLQPGRNWVQLELLDEQGNLVPNAFNNTVRLIDYQPGGTDTLSQLMRGELSAADAMYIVDPNYVPPAPEPKPEPEPEPEPDMPPAPATEIQPESELEPGEIPEVVPDAALDETPDAAIGQPSAPKTPSILEPSPTAPPPASPPALQPDLEPAIEPQAKSEAIEPLQETKVKEQLTEEVEAQLKQLESPETETIDIQETQELPIPSAASQSPLEAPIAPLDSLTAPDKQAKLFDRAKHFLNRVLPHPTEPTPAPSLTPVPPTPDTPTVIRPDDAVEIEETLTHPT